MTQLVLLIFLMVFQSTFTDGGHKDRQQLKEKCGVLLTTIVGQALSADSLLIQEEMKKLTNFVKSYGLCREVVDEIVIRHVFSQGSQQFSLMHQTLFNIKTSAEIKMLRIQEISRNEKFRINQQALSNHYLLIDIDTIISCETISLGYEQHLYSKSPPNSVSLSGFQGAAFSFTNSPSKPPFQYTESTENFYSMIQSQQSFISKHLLQLYYINLTEINMLRQIVQINHDCEDIVFNAIVAHFYVQFIPRLIVGQLGKTINHNGKAPNQIMGAYSLNKSKCLKEITQVLGSNPLRNYRTNKTQGQSRWQNPAYAGIMQAKHVILDELIKGSHQVPLQTIEKSLRILEESEQSIKTIYATQTSCLSQKTQPIIDQSFYLKLRQASIQQMISAIDRTDNQMEKERQSSQQKQDQLAHYAIRLLTEGETLNYVIYLQMVFLVLGAMAIFKQLGNKNQHSVVRQEESQTSLA